MARDIGRAGEAFVEQWCALAGITANKSVVDRHGWDLHFEMPHEWDITKADGLHQSDLECKVQIKTTDTKKMTESIELSNLRSMATSSMPTFYLLVRLGGGNQIVSAHLLHLDEAHCNKILARIRRELDKSGELKLNKKTMSLNFKSGVEITPLGGDSLKAEIIKCIGSSQAEYVTRKQKFLRSVGYDDQSFLVRMQIDMEHADRFVRMLLGDNETVEVKSVDATVTRFGISESFAGMRSDTAIMSVANVLPDGRAHVVFRNRKTGAASELDFDMYRGGLADCIPLKHRVVRLRSTCFSMDIPMHGNSMKFKFHVEDDAALDVMELLKNYKLVQLLSTPSEVDIRIDIAGRVLNGKLGGEGFGSGFDHSIEMLEAVVFIKNYYGYYSKIGLCSRWFERFGLNLLQYKKLIDERVDVEKVSFTFECADANVNPTSEVECLVALPIVLDNKCFVSVIAFCGVPVLQDDNRYKVYASSMSGIYKTYFTIEYLASGNAMKELEGVVDSYESTRTVVPFLNQLMDKVVDNAKLAVEKDSSTS